MLWLIIIGTMVAGGVAYFFSQRMEPVYQATTTLMVRQEQNPTSIVSPYYSQPLTFTYVQLIRKRSVMEGVISELDLAYTTGELVKKIKVSTIANTNLLELSAEDTNPLLAQQIANTTAEVFSQQYQQQIKTETTSALSVIGSEIAELEKKSENAELSSEEINRLNELHTLRTLWRIQLTQAQATGGVIPWELASLPTSPVRPNILQNVLLACLLGLVVTGGSAFLIEHLSRTVETAEDVSKLTGLPTLGAIMRFKTKKEERSKLVTEARPRSSVAEVFRVVRTNLQFVTVDKPNQTLLVSSSSPQEGKTLFTANLAVSLAQTGKRVILVDADLRHGDMHELFELPNPKTRGFSSLLVEQSSDVASFLYSTRIEGLKVIPLGSHAPNPAELFSSPRIDFVINELRKEADIVLFDSPPILAVADTIILAPKLDGVILLVEAGKTRPEALTDAKEALAKGNANILGVVLNKIEVGGGYYYRYRYPYYHRYYSQYYTEEEGGRKRREHRKRSLLGRLLRRREKVHTK